MVREAPGAAHRDVNSGMHVASQSAYIACARRLLRATASSGSGGENVATVWWQRPQALWRQRDDLYPWSRPTTFHRACVCRQGLLGAAIRVDGSGEAPSHAHKLSCIRCGKRGKALRSSTYNERMPWSPSAPAIMSSAPAITPKLRSVRRRGAWWVCVGVAS